MIQMKSLGKVPEPKLKIKGSRYYLNAFQIFKKSIWLVLNAIFLSAS